MYRDTNCESFPTWTALEKMPTIAVGNRGPIITTTEEAVTVLANKYTGVYRNKPTQQFVFVAWHYDMPFWFSAVSREMWWWLPIWTEETIKAMADEWGVGDLFSLCGTNKKSWGIVRDAIRAAMNDHNIGSVIKWY